MRWFTPPPPLAQEARVAERFEVLRLLGPAPGVLGADEVGLDEAHERLVHRLHADTPPDLHHARQLVGLVLADEVADRHRPLEDLEDRHPPLAVLPGEEGLAHDVLEGLGQGHAHLALLLGREALDEAVHGGHRAGGVQGPDHEVAGLGGGERQPHRLHVAHLADDDDVGILAQRGPERPREAHGVGAHLPLVHQRGLHRVHELDRVFEGDDVVGLRLVDQVHDRGERGALAAPGRSADQDDPPVVVQELGEPSGDAQLGEGRGEVGDDAEGGAPAAALMEGVHPVAPHLGDGVAEVELARLLQRLGLPRAQDGEDGLAGAVGVQGPDPLHALEGAELSHPGRLVHGEVQVRGTLVADGGEEAVDGSREALGRHRGSALRVVHGDGQAGLEVPEDLGRAGAYLARRILLLHLAEELDQAGVGEPGEGADHLDAHLGPGVAEDPGQRLERRHRAELGQRVDRRPPALVVVEGLHQRSHGALVLEPGQGVAGGDAEPPVRILEHAAQGRDQAGVVEVLGEDEGRGAHVRLGVGQQRYGRLEDAVAERPQRVQDAVAQPPHEVTAEGQDLDQHLPRIPRLQDDLHAHVARAVLARGEELDHLLAHDHRVGLRAGAEPVAREVARGGVPPGQAVHHELEQAPVLQTRGGLQRDGAHPGVLVGGEAEEELEERRRAPLLDRAQQEWSPQGRGGLGQRPFQVAVTPLAPDRRVEVPRQPSPVGGLVRQQGVHRLARHLGWQAAQGADRVAAHVPGRALGLLEQLGDGVAVGVGQEDVGAQRPDGGVPAHHQLDGVSGTQARLSGLGEERVPLLHRLPARGEELLERVAATAGEKLHAGEHRARRGRDATRAASPDAGRGVPGPHSRTTSAAHRAQSR